MVRTAPTPISAGWPNSRAAAEPSARGDATRPPEGKGDQRDVKGISRRADDRRSEEHTSELQSLMRISYAVFCLKKKTRHKEETTEQTLKVTRSRRDNETRTIN